MTRRAFAFSAFTIPAIGQFNLQDNLLQNSRKFNFHWSLFYRKLLNCPAGAVHEEDCHPQTGSADAHQFRAARSAAKELFKLEDA